MTDAVVVTELVWAKGKDVFARCSELSFSVSPECEDELAAAVRAAPARAAIVGAVPYRGPLYDALAEAAAGRPALIARFGVGHDGIDKQLAAERNIVVTNTPGVLETSVAEHAMFLIGTLARHIVTAAANVKAGRFEAPTGIELSGRTLGIVGFGAIGSRLAQIAHFGFGMTVLAADVLSVGELEQRHGASLERIRQRFGLQRYTQDVDAVFREADVVSIHVPATEATRHLLDARRLALMRPTALLVNTARGAVLDEIALYDVLASNRIAGAALDVFQREPYEPLDPAKDLRRLDNVVLSPHIGSNTRQSNRRMAEATLANVRAFFAGQFDRLTTVGG